MGSATSFHLKLAFFFKVRMPMRRVSVVFIAPGKTALLSEGLDPELGPWIIGTNILLLYLLRALPFQMFFSLISSWLWSPPFIRNMFIALNFEGPCFSLSPPGKLLHCYIRSLTIQIGFSVFYWRGGGGGFFLYIWRIKWIHSICFG